MKYRTMKIKVFARHRPAIATLLRRTLVLIPCVVLLGGVQTSRAMMPAPVISTNIITGEVTTNFFVAPPGSQANQPRGLRAKLYLFWWDLKDYAYYGVPYVVRNDPPAVVVSGLGLLALGCVTFRSFRRSRKMPTRNDYASKNDRADTAKTAQGCRTEMDKRDDCQRSASPKTRHHSELSIK